MRLIDAALWIMQVAGMVHRDISPKDIMLVDDRTVKLIDLDLAAEFPPHDPFVPNKARSV